MLTTVDAISGSTSESFRAELVHEVAVSPAPISGSTIARASIG